MSGFSSFRVLLCKVRALAGHLSLGLGVAVHDELVQERAGFAVRVAFGFGLFDLSV